MEVTIRKNLKELETLFDLFNKHFYSGKLEKPVVTMSPNMGARKTALGWCSVKQIWHNKQDESAYYEISICPEFMDRDIYEISATLLHEMVHLYNTQNNIQDCSRNGSYHNKKFKNAAETKGLIISFNKKYGWHDTKLNANTITWINSNVKVGLTPLIRGGGSTQIPTSEDEAEEKKKTCWKYTCPCCENSVRATKELNIICGDCNIKMKEE